MNGAAITLTNIGHSEQENQSVTLSDSRIFGFAEYGDLTGPPLVYIHGSGNCRYEAGAFHEYGQKYKVRVIGVDRPGMGLSTIHKNRTLLDIANDINELADHLKLSHYSVAGTSGGAPHALACAYTFPERIDNCGIIVPIGPRTPGAAGWTLKQRLMYDMVRWFPKLYMKFVKAGIKKMLNRDFIEKHLNKLPGCEADRQLFADKEIWSFMTSIQAEGSVQGIEGLTQELQLFARKGNCPWGFKLDDMPTSVQYSMWVGKLDDLYMHGVEMAEKLPNCDYQEFAELGHLSAVFHNLEGIVRQFRTTPDLDVSVRHGNLTA